MNLVGYLVVWEQWSPVFKGGHMNEEISEMEMEDWQEVEILKAVVEADAGEFASPENFQGMDEKWAYCAASKRD